MYAMVRPALKLAFLVALAALALPLPQRVAGQSDAEWIRVGQDVGWSTRDDFHGPFRVKETICARQIKLVHKKGGVTCDGTKNYK